MKLLLESSELRGVEVVLRVLCVILLILAVTSEEKSHKNHFLKLKQGVLDTRVDHRHHHHESMFSDSYTTFYNFELFTTLNLNSIYI